MVYDVITVGSATVDVFLRTRSKDVEIERVHAHEDVCLPVGAKILIDKLNTDTGGGGTNTAVAFSRLGLKTGWVGKIGTDVNSKIVLDEIRRERIDFLGCQAEGSTGYSVILSGLNSNRTILAYKGMNDTLRPADVKWNKLNTKWLYCSAMLGQSWKTLVKIVSWAKKNNVKYAFNPSLYLAEKGMKELASIVNGCDLLILNREEAQALTGTKKRCVELLPMLQKHAHIVVITDGEKDAHAYNGFEHYRLTPTKKKVVEATGAGDAFAAGMLAGIILKQDLGYAMQLGHAEAASVLSHVGAKQKLLTRAEIVPARLFVERM
jgi:ribokinase